MNWLAAVTSRVSSASSAVVVKGGANQPLTLASVVRSPCAMVLLLGFARARHDALARLGDAHETMLLELEPRRLRHLDRAVLIHAIDAALIGDLPTSRRRLHFHGRCSRSSRNEKGASRALGLVGA